jgi:hypothetical protein
VCVVWAPSVVTRSEPMDKFGKCLEPAGELHRLCCSRNGETTCWGFRFSGITLLDKISQCRRKRLLVAYTMCCLCSLVYGSLVPH